MEHKFVYFQNKKIHYQDEGQGNKTIVLLHGFMNSHEVWSSFVYSYMRELRIIAIDLPGHGKSEVVQEEHSMDLMADIVKAVLEHAKINKCILIGHSMGGYVTAAFAGKYPDSLLGFGFLHSHVLKDDEETIQNRYRNCSLVEQNRAGFIVSFIPSLFDESKRQVLQNEIVALKETALSMSEKAIVAAQMGMAKRESRLDVLINANVPILFIFGKKDSRISLELGISQAMLPKHAEILLLDNVAHMGHFEARNIVKELVRSFAEMCYKYL